jgi:V/A-type H+-transporting ATPase subunit G/H
VSRADTLLKVKDAEAKAKEIIKEAEDKQKTINSATRKDATRMISEAEGRLVAEFDSAFVQERQKVAAQKEELMARGRQDADKLKAKAAQNVPKAKAYVKERFERTIDASS